MRKQVTGQTGSIPSQAKEGENWLDLEALAQVEVSSEAPGYGIENALVPGSTRPWQAATPGEAHITLRFDAPQQIERIRLHFVDAEHERSQEWAVSAHFADGSRRELVRQGWNFSPGGSTEQAEEYALGLKQVTALSLWIDGDRGRNRYPATLTTWRVGATG
jgi:hypothetical protein